MSREQQIRDRVAAAPEYGLDSYMSFPLKHDDDGIVVDDADRTIFEVDPDGNHFTNKECETVARLLIDRLNYAPKADLTYLLDRVKAKDARIKELEDALEIVNNGVDDFGGSYVNLQVQMSEVEEGRAVLAKRNL